MSAWAASTFNVVGPLSGFSLGILCSICVMALMAVFYAMLRGKLRPESAIREAREDRDDRIREAREDRDARLESANRQIEMWKNNFEIAETARRNQEVLLRETTLEIGRTVQHVLGALQEARLQVRGESSKDA